ncbi:DHA2 family efflux MFS transporter permease subunit [Patulibacter defluvii]|uniref:DHA2 family efflux MFS transporter permease subunit n=1 Tax=Patulibacter defluvii TaxID=3095358 RepID=UPI002A748530|nr:DHA2 family efflux MFS transporter permease subunit [Patulibacter sp. DM4]
MSAVATTTGPAARERGDERPGAIPAAVWRLAAVIAFGAFMSGLDTSVVNVGLDAIARDLDGSLAAVQWVANGYLVALAVSLPACGWLVRRLGAGRLWLWALAGFTVASGLCALAPDLPSLIALRVLQGLTAGLLIPAGQTVLGQAVGPERLGRVMATLGVAVTLAPALGPTVGGLLLEVAPWPWLFLLNLPFGIVALVAGRRLVPRGDATAGVPLDRGGLLLLSAGLPLVVLGATVWGEQRTLATPGALLPLLLGGAALALFVGRSRGRTDPLLDLGLLRDRRFAAACATSAFAGATLFGAGLVLPLFFQLARGEDAMTSGLSLILLGLGSTAALPLTGRLVDRFGGGPVSAWGGLAAVATTLPFALVPVDAPWWLLQLLLLVRGVALALAMMPAMTAAYKAVRPAQLPDASTQVNIVLRIGGALGGALFAVVLAGALPDGPTAAFHQAFWWLTGASLLGLAAALWLTVAERCAARDG